MNANSNQTSATAKAAITLNNIKRNQVVELAIPAMRPIKTLNGVLHESGQKYKVLGTHGTAIRLSRISDCQKIIINVEALIAA